MSDSSQQDAEYISELTTILFQNRVLVAATAFYAYEWLVTLDQEVNHIWARKWSLSTWVFVINRHVTLLAVIMQLLPTPNNTSCIALTRLQQALTILQFLALALFSGLRASAICHRSIWIFLIVFGLSAVPIPINMVLFIKESPLFGSTPGDIFCTVLLPFSASEILKLALITRGAVVLADVIVLIVTWKATIGTVREAARCNIKVPLSEILIRDGTIFFLALLAINIIQILANTVPYLQNHLPGIALLQPLSGIIVSRFMLNLRQAVRDSELPNNTTNQSTIHFNSNILVGNLGQSLKFGAEYDEPELMTDHSEDSSEESVYFEHTDITSSQE